eukprot:gene5920-7369_t
MLSRTRSSSIENNKQQPQQKKDKDEEKEQKQQTTPIKKSILKSRNSSDSLPTTSSSSSSSNNNNSNNSTTTQQQGTNSSLLTHLLISRYSSKPISSTSNSKDNSNNSSASLHTWIFNLPYPSYVSIEAKLGSKIILNIKQQNVLLKQGDRFYFSITVPTKVDRIISLATVISNPIQSKSDPTTTDVTLQFEKIFSEPVPRSVFSEHPTLSDLVTSKSSFTRVSDSQLSLFQEILNSYTVAKSKNEALNFLTHISLGSKKKNEDTDESSNVQQNLNNPSVGVGGTSLQQPLSQQQTQQQQQQQQLQYNQSNPLPIQQPSSTAPTQPQLQHTMTQQQLQLQQQLQIQQQTQLPQLQQQQLPNPQILSSTPSSTITIIENPLQSSKRNTIEEFNSNYNISVQQRIFFTTSSGHPVAVFSLIRGDTRKNPKHGKGGKREKESADSSITSHSQSETSMPSKDSGVAKSKEISYANLLSSNTNLIGDEVDGSTGIPLKYDPSFLDNSELKTGKHRTVMNLPSYKISIFPFIKKGAIKEELNEQFRQKHTWINQPGVTLYKIRKVKRKLKKICILAGIEMSTLALAYVLMEKLIMKNVLSKPTFKLYSSLCLLLAAKFNDPMALESLAPLFENIEKRFSIPKKELLASEFFIFTQVSFGLFIDHNDVLPHLSRLKSELEETNQNVFIM